ncbi:hypothetical protein HWV62_13044 [Athelia sp. TMB]|nr:hypothetical protein HWV62_13044 [Athelia sp. TMB]
MDPIINPLLYPALAELKDAVAALDPSGGYTAMLAQFQLVEIALARAKLERATVENRSIPIASLPHEVLSGIFEIHRDLHYESDPMWEDGIAPSIPISHVSAMWRDIALSTASLWRVITSYPPYTDEFYRTMIRRSRESSLEFTIRVEDPRDMPSANVLAALIPSHTHRLRTLNFKAPIDFIDSHIPALRELSAPRMTRLYFNNTIQENVNSSGPPKPLQLIFTGGIPMLAHFYAVNFDLRIRPSLISVKMLVMTYGDVAAHNRHLALREAAPTIHRLITQMSPGALSTVMVIKMPSLEKLHIAAPFPEIAMFLGMIEAPILDCLSLYPTVSGRLLPLSHVHNSVVGKYPSLWTLQLRGKLGSGILAAFPTIRCLYIQDDSPSRLTRLRDIFDPKQDAFSTLTPHLGYISSPNRFKESIEAFGDARQSLGLSVPRFFFF